MAVDWTRIIALALGGALASVVGEVRLEDERSSSETRVEECAKTWQTIAVYMAENP